VVFLGRLTRFRSLMYVPLVVAGTRCVGALAVAARAPHAYRDADLEILTTLADQVAVGINNALLVEAAERRADQLEQLSVAGQRLAAHLDLDAVLQHSVDEVARLFQVARASVFLTDENHQPTAAAHHPPGEPVYTPAARSEGLGWLVAQPRPLAVPDLRDTEALPGLRMRLIERGVHSVLLVPIVLRGQVKGALLLYATEGRRAFGRESQELARIVAGQIAAAVENARLYAAAVHAKTRTETVVRSAFAAILTVDEAGRIREANPAALTLLERDAANVLGQPLDDVLGIPLWADVDGPIGHARQAGRAGPPVERSVPSRGDARDRAVLVGAAPLPDGWLVSMADITRLKEVDRLKSELVANVSHELRAPLTSIKAYAELLLQDIDEGDEALRREFVQIIDAEAERLAACINNLLDLARVEAEGYQLRPEAFGLADFVRSTAAAVAPRATMRGVQLAVDTPVDGTTLHADRPILFSMLKNLVDNAVKFSAEGDAVHIRAGRAADGGVDIAVTDEGPGIPPDQLSAIFEKFFRVESATHAAVEGSGLGLVIARQAARAHGGEISVTSELGRGSTFRVHLPATIVAADGAGPAPSRSAA
jgi:signal transduction histidine kinase